MSYMCEIEGCDQQAYSEYKRQGEEYPDTYSTYRCERHKPFGLDYEEFCPVCGEDMDSGHYNNNAECDK